jgi:hypothetical protein
MNGSKRIAKCVSVPGLTPLLDQTDGASDGIFCLCIGDCQFERRSTILAIKVRTHLRVNVEPSLPLGSSLMTRPPYAVARYDVGSSKYVSGMQLGGEATKSSVRNYV